MDGYKLRIELPYLKGGRVFYFDDDTGDVFAFLDGKIAEYSLRPALSQYLWLLRTDGDKYFSKIT